MDSNVSVQTEQYGAVPKTNAMIHAIFAVETVIMEHARHVQITHIVVTEDANVKLATMNPIPHQLNVFQNGVTRNVDVDSTSNKITPGLHVQNV
jgi:hypothetical protein